jgi:Ca2+/Na+ antiporter
MMEWTIKIMLAIISLLIPLLALSLWRWEGFVIACLFILYIFLRDQSEGQSA